MAPGCVGDLLSGGRRTDLYKVVIGGEDICLLVFLFFSIY